MEKELFIWTEWDKVGEACFGFYGIQLVNPLGKYPKGTIFDWAQIDYENGLLTLGNDAYSLYPLFSGSLQLKVQEIK